MSEKVRGQYKHAISLNDDISKFNCLWISFNCFYNIEINRWSDREKINKIKDNTKIKQVFLWLKKDLKDIFFSFINERDNKWVINLKNGKTSTYLCVNCFWEFLEIIYTIRNNQFHWWKDWKSENDIRLLKAANIIFENFLKELYREYEIL